MMARERLDRDFELTVLFDFLLVCISYPSCHSNRLDAPGSLQDQLSQMRMLLLPVGHGLVSASPASLLHRLVLPQSLL